MSEPKSDLEKSELVTMLADLDNRDAAGESANPDIPSTVHLHNSEHIEKHLKCSRLLRKIFSKPDRPRSSLTLYRGGAVGTEQSARPDSTSLKELTQIDRFKIRSMLGSGGCGYVFLAWDPALSRFVALKVPTAETLVSTDRRARFKQEARAAAILAHPNIVPVFESGDMGPVSYICYEYCPGETLAQWLSAQTEPVPFSLCAAMMIPIAEGVAHAHTRGVLHRDLKPGNIILQREEDSTGQTEPIARTYGLPFVPRITDFGLAKMIVVTEDAGTESFGKSDHQISMHTRTETVMGTPAYMSPEQARGAVHEVTTLGDVYSLGAILYQMLTGHPPFQAATSMETLEMVMNRDPVPPSKLRRNVPRDLETICLKCLEKQPRRRYSSAAELAEDLRRYVSGDAISARPVSGAERINRWCRKNPNFAAFTGLVMVLFVAGVISIFFLWRRAEDEAGLRVIERDLAIKERDRAEGNLRLAGEMVDHLMKAGDELAAFSNLTSKRREILEHAQSYYAAFQAQSESFEATLESSRMLTRLARISLTLRQFDEALDALRRSHDLLVKLDLRFPGNKETKVERAWVLWNIAICSVQNRQIENANKIYGELIPLYEELIREYPNELMHQSWLANALMNNANYLPAKTPDSEAMAKLKRAEKIQRELLAKQPNSMRFRSELALTAETLGKIDLDCGRDHSALIFLTQAIDDRERLLTENPRNEENKEYLARCLLHRGFVHYRQSNYSLALKDESRSVSLMQVLADKYRDLPSYKDLLARALLRKGQALCDSNRLKEGKQSLLECVKLLEDIGPLRNPSYMYGQQTLANILLGDCHYKLHEMPEAEQRMRQALVLEPKSFTAMYALATIIRLDETHVTARLIEGDALITKALKMAPRNVPALLTAAEIKQLLGDQASARTLFQKVLVVDPLFRWTNAFTVIGTEIRLGQYKEAFFRLGDAIQDSYRVTVEELFNQQAASGK